jgi:predicted homoserine dehydrogenase-like protein
MNYLRYFAAARPPIETCIVGTGGFGRSFLAQGLRVPMMKARVSVDRDAAVAAEALRSVGVEPRRRKAAPIWRWAKLSCARSRRIG